MFLDLLLRDAWLFDLEWKVGFECSLDLIGDLYFFSTSEYIEESESLIITAAVFI